MNSETELDCILNRGLCAAANPQCDQQDVIECFNMLISCADGWKTCAKAFLSFTYRQNDQCQFFCLKVCEDYLRIRYAASEANDKVCMRKFVMECLKMVSESVVQKSFMLNKLAQLCSLVFVMDYPMTWPDFFADLLSCVECSQSHTAVDLFLRILLAIDEEVVDRDVVHSFQESSRNTAIKDHMRERCVTRLAEFWLSVLMGYEVSQPALTRLCLEVVGKYVSWIDVGLVANPRYVAVLLHFLSQPPLRLPACDCIYEVLSKGMDGMTKFHLVSGFCSVLVANRVLAPPVDEDKDYLCKLSRLMCGVGQALLYSWNKLELSPDSAMHRADIEAAVDDKLPYLLRFFGDDDDDVSVMVADFLIEHIAWMKSKNSSLTECQLAYCQNLFDTTVRKMKFDDSFNFDQEGEDEAEFMEYRKRLKLVLNNLVQLDPDKMLMSIHGTVSQTLSRWRSIDFRDVEIALYLLYNIGEAVPASHGQHFTGSTVKVPLLQDMLQQLIASEVSSHGNAAVQLQFFEIVARYDKFLQAEPLFIPKCMGAFLDHRGLHHPSAKVRSRCSYLFSRIVKSLKSQMTLYSVDIFKGIQDLLLTNSVVGGTSNSATSRLSDEDLLFIYEAASMLIISNLMSPEEKQENMKQLLLPIATEFKDLLVSLSSEQDMMKQTDIARRLYNCMSLASRASKGFSNTQTMKQCGCVEVFVELLHLFPVAFDTNFQRSLVQAGVRQFLHRMVVCFDSDILPHVSPILLHLLHRPEANHLRDFLPLLNQLVMKFKVNIVPYLAAILMPIVHTVLALIASSVDVDDSERMMEVNLLRRSYFLFLSTVVSNGCVGVFCDLGGNDVDMILASIIQGIMACQDPHSQKYCFSTLRKLIEAYGSEFDRLPGFAGFIYKSVVPACLQAPLHPSFDLKDAVTMQALGESAWCLKMVLEKRGEELLQFLMMECLPLLNLSEELCQQFCQALLLDIKSYKAYLKEFFTKARS